MEGKVVHTWKLGTNPHLLDNGHLLDATRDDPSGFQGFQEVDWDSKVVWECHEDAKAIRRITTGSDPQQKAPRRLRQFTSPTKRLLISRRSRPAPIRKTAPMTTPEIDVIVEVDVRGNVVWEWWFLDHVVQDMDSRWPTTSARARPSPTTGPDQRQPAWPSAQARLAALQRLDYNAEQGQIVTARSRARSTSSTTRDLHRRTIRRRASRPQPARRATSFTASATPRAPARANPRASSRTGTPPRPATGRSAAATTCTGSGPACPAQGIRRSSTTASISWTNVPVFDRRDQSLPRRSRQRHRPIRESARCRLRAAPYPTEDTHKPPKRVSRQIVWSYQSKANQGFFSHIGSGSQRLPNGNTLICSGTTGHLFEVTAKGELVWEYINPISRELGTVKVLPDVLPMTNALFRAARYFPDHPALKGHELKPIGLITDAFSRQPDPRAAQGGPPGRRGDDRPAPARVDQDAAAGADRKVVVVLGVVTGAAGWIVRTVRTTKIGHDEARETAETIHESGNSKSHHPGDRLAAGFGTRASSPTHVTFRPGRTSCSFWRRARLEQHVGANGRRHAAVQEQLHADAELREARTGRDAVRQLLRSIAALHAVARRRILRVSAPHVCT